MVVPVPGDADGGGVCRRRTSDRGNKHGDNNTSDAWNDLQTSNRKKGEKSDKKPNSHEDHQLYALSFISAL
jgi:hypothetical protein